MATNPAPAKRPAIYRTRFFVASLWSSLTPVALMAAVCIVIVLLPEGMNKIVDSARRAAGVALILVPFVYTGLVITAYGIGRLLHLINLLSRVTLIIANVILSLAGAGLVAWANSVLGVITLNNALLFGIVAAACALALSVSVLVWWRVASHIPAPPEPKKRQRRHSSREQAGETE